MTECSYHSVQYSGRYCFICDDKIYKEELENARPGPWKEWLVVVKEAYPKNINGRKTKVTEGNS